MQLTNLSDSFPGSLTIVSRIEASTSNERGLIYQGGINDYTVSADYYPNLLLSTAVNAVVTPNEPGPIHQRNMDRGLAAHRIRGNTNGHPPSADGYSDSLRIRDANRSVTPSERNSIRQGSISGHPASADDYSHFVPTAIDDTPSRKLLGCRVIRCSSCYLRN